MATKASWHRNYVTITLCIVLVLVDIDLPYWTSKVEHLVAFTAIFSKICTAHAQKRLFMNFRCKFRHRHSIRRPRFSIKVQNFSDLATFFFDFCILYAECPPYFYFRFVWPSDLESIPHASTPTSIIPTRFEVDMTIHCRLIAFWPWTVVIHGGSRDQPCHQVCRPYAHPFLSYEL